MNIYNTVEYIEAQYLTDFASIPHDQSDGHTETRNCECFARNGRLEDAIQAACEFAALNDLSPMSIAR